MPRRVLSRFLAILSLAPWLTGCAGLGAARVGIDRGDYTERLRESEKTQLLSNIVAMRYGEAPMFLSVASVISQYTRESSGRLHASLDPPVDGEGGSADGAVLFRETPTVTYTPMSGERFAHSMLAPLPPASLLAMVEAGWAVDDLFALSLRSIRGLRNGSRAPLFAQTSDPAFGEVTAALRRLQLSGAMNVRLVAHDNTFTAVGRIRPDLTPADVADLATLRSRLNLEATGEGLRIVFASDAGGERELSLATRSIFEVLQDLAQGVETGDGAPAPDRDTLVRVRSGPAAPADAHVAIRRHGRWYWIDGADERSKRLFLLVQVMTSLTDDSGGARSPLVTIPAG
jgi:hypothetical protein